MTPVETIKEIAKNDKHSLDVFMIEIIVLQSDIPEETA